VVAVDDFDRFWWMALFTPNGDRLFTWLEKF